MTDQSLFQGGQLTQVMHNTSVGPAGRSPFTARQLSLAANWLVPAAPDSLLAGISVLLVSWPYCTWFCLARQVF